MSTYELTPRLPDHILEWRRQAAEEEYERRLAQARREKAEEWPEHRAEIMRARYANEQKLRAAGRPFVMHPEPPVECPAEFLAGVQVAPVPISHEPPPKAHEAGAEITPESAFAAAAKPSISDRMKAAVARKSA